jgi:hypothetical protein
MILFLGLVKPLLFAVYAVHADFGNAGKTLIFKQFGGAG